MFTNSPNLAAWTARNFPETVSTLDARKVGGRQPMFKAFRRRLSPVRVTRKAGPPIPPPRPGSRVLPPRRVMVGKRGARRFMGEYGSMVGGMVPAGIVGANPTMAAWDYDQTPGLGKSWLAKRLKITSKTFAKLKPSSIFATALNVVAPGSVAAIKGGLKVGSTVYDATKGKQLAAAAKKKATQAVEQAAARAAAARAELAKATTQAAADAGKAELLQANIDLKTATTNESQAERIVAQVEATPPGQLPPIVSAVAPIVARSADMQPTRNAAARASDEAAADAVPSVATRRAGMSGKTVGLIGAGVALAVLLVVMRRK